MLDVRAGAILLALAAALLVASVVILVRSPPGSAAANDFVQRVDQNGNGVIDEAEYRRVGDGELAFVHVDADGNGVLEPWEVDVLLRSVSPLRASMAWVLRAL